MDKKLIEKIVISTVQELADSFTDEDKFSVSKETILFGQGSEIDSLSLVSVIVDLEDIISENYGIDISLTDDNAMTREISPFDNVSNLIDYIEEITN